jgi:predicted AAA+ superfamily ATPase
VGLVYRVNRVSTALLPLAAYRELEAFKLYLVDVGLLSAMAGLSAENLAGADDSIFTHFRGALTEQFVLQELKTIPELQVYYWSADKGTAEVDFILGSGTLTMPDALPLEVKAEINLQAKSLKSYREQFAPKLSLRTSLAPYHEGGSLVDVPLYALRQWMRRFQECPN